MTLIPVLILAAGLNAAASNPLPASHAQQVAIRPNRTVALATPVLHHRTVSRAVAAGGNRPGTDIARELALGHLKTMGSLTPGIESRSNHLIGEPGPGLDTRHFSPVPKPDSALVGVQSDVIGSTLQAAHDSPGQGFPASLVGGLLIGFLALASLAAMGFWRRTG